MYIKHVQVTVAFQLDEPDEYPVDVGNPRLPRRVSARPGCRIDIVGRPREDLFGRVVAPRDEPHGGTEHFHHRIDVIGAHRPDERRNLHFPIQKLEKMRPSRSSLVNSPVISFRAC